MFIPYGSPMHGTSPVLEVWNEHQCGTLSSSVAEHWAWRSGPGFDSWLNGPQKRISLMIIVLIYKCCYFVFSVVSVNKIHFVQFHCSVSLSLCLKIYASSMFLDNLHSSCTQRVLLLDCLLLFGLFGNVWKKTDVFLCIKKSVKRKKRLST